MKYSLRPRVSRRLPIDQSIPARIV